MKKVIWLFPAVLLMWASVASAHGPTRQKVTESIVINASADAVWERIKNFADASWMPMVAKTAGQGGNVAGATRELTLKSAGVIKEELRKHEEAEKSFSYKIVKDGVDMKVLPVNDYSSKITVTAEGSGAKVEWNGAFYRGYMNNCPCPPELNEQAALSAVSKIYQESLANLKALVEGKK
jgi:hypothetical protein